MYRKIPKYATVQLGREQAWDTLIRNDVYVSVPKFNPGIRKTKMEECKGPDVRGRGRGGEVGVAPHPH